MNINNFRRVQRQNRLKINNIIRMEKGRFMRFDLAK